jgi:di/tricarboxylate transporter
LEILYFSINLLKKNFAGYGHFGWQLFMLWTEIYHSTLSWLLGFLLKEIK